MVMFVDEIDAMENVIIQAIGQCQKYTAASDTECKFTT
jgi:hypothetical protein